MAMIDRLRPAKRGSGFTMDGWFVWCGSVLRENGRFYLFASRWPEETGFPAGYMTHSEIVLAETDSLDRPFRYVKTLLPGRGDQHWDGAMTHNPFIMKINGEYVLVDMPYTEDWDIERRRQVARDIGSDSYITYAAFDGEKVVGFIGLLKQLKDGHMILGKS